MSDNNGNAGYGNEGSRNSGHMNGGDCNSGDRNSGQWNGGDWNSGDWNSGHQNNGNGNSGNKNSGEWNSGHKNVGHRNSGNNNIGGRNSGNGNIGDWNSGNWNKGNNNAGFFNTDGPYVRLFNKISNLKFSDDIITKLKHINVLPVLEYIHATEMTEKEKIEYPYYRITGGYLKNTGKQDWTQLKEVDKLLIKSLPNFDNDVFEEITGIRL